MAQYFFHLHECGTITADDEGIDLPDIEEVRSRAVMAARDVMAAEVADGRLCLGCYIQVTDARGEPVLRVPFNEAIVISGL